MLHQPLETKKLDKWADLLLDIGKRNNLINFKETKTSTVEILTPTGNDLFEKVNRNTKLEVFDPKIIDEEDFYFGEENTSTQPPLIEIKNDLNDKELFISQHSRQLTKQSQILVFNSKKNPVSALWNIHRKAKEHIEGTGINVAHIAIGFIHWKEIDSSNIVFRAPILLVPIQIERASAIDPFYITPFGDDVVLNPTLIYKVETEYGIHFPAYSGGSLDEYLKKVSSVFLKLNWQVTTESFIGIFSFLKINMYRDLKDNQQAILSNANVRLLLGEPPDHSETTAYENIESKVSNPLIQLHNIVDADYSQIEAIKLAKTGQSFVLQGPPGTGKSQTIANIIAECLYDGKKVLFVSEKLAALNIVYEKLKKVQLSEFCLELHSHKANKKSVIADINKTLKSPSSAVSSNTDKEIAIKEEAQNHLDSYAKALHASRPGINKSLFNLFGALSALKAAPDIEWIIPQITTKGENYLQEVTFLLEQYVEYLPIIGYDYKKNPWYHLIYNDTSYEAKLELKANLISAVDFLKILRTITSTISDQYDIIFTSVNEAKQFQKFFHLIATTKILTPALFQKNLFKNVISNLNKIKTISSSILANQKLIDTTCNKNIYKIKGDLYYNKLTNQFDGFLSRLFNKEYKNIKNDLQLCKKNGKKISYLEAVALTKYLSVYQNNILEFQGLENQIKHYVGPSYTGLNTNWKYVAEQMNSLYQIISSDIQFGTIAEYSQIEFFAEQDNFKEIAKRFDKCFDLCTDEIVNLADFFNDPDFDIKSNDFKKPLKRFEACLREIDNLAKWYHFKDLLSKIKEKQIILYIDYIISSNMEAKYFVSSFQKQFYYQWIESILSTNALLSTFNRFAQDKMVDTFVKKDKLHFEINRLKIRESLSSRRPSLDVIVQGSAISKIIREGEKRRRQKSIRSLFAETGELVQIIKPCFLMSPLSISTYLGTNSIHFDVVIFDEASQIFPQDAICAIYRAKQLIVVGDSKQMPPSNFFNTTIGSEDDEEEFDDITGFESILDLCSTFMKQLRLNWHYRSRYESLITFSNENFYDNTLITFPSPKADESGIGVDYYHVNGLYDRKSRTNRKEAEFIVDLIYKNIEKYPNRSIGVIAFSISQQNLIDLLLTKRRQSAPEKESFFNENKNEPFFIKNLETVQGDERDTIIFSIAYGFDARGRFYHMFGPLNRLGGERRLNVAITRAKHNVQLVSSIRYTNIDLNRTSSEGVRLLRNYLNFAENGDKALIADLSVPDFDHFDSDFELEVCDFLRENGFSVVTQVGCSGYKIDLGLRLPNSSEFVLAIECDGASYHALKNARDRDRLRQEILEQMGWNFYRIWSTDWYSNKLYEQTRLLEKANIAIKNARENFDETQDNDNPENNILEYVIDKSINFPKYKMAVLNNSFDRYFSFKKMVLEILKTEAPLSEELLLKRVVPYFNRQKVTSVVRNLFEQEMYDYETYGILRKQGFLYLKTQDEVQFRLPGDLTRDIKNIAPEELAAGMKEILKQNIKVDKKHLYRTLSHLCGVNRINQEIIDYFDDILSLLKNFVSIDNDIISVKRA